MNYVAIDVLNTVAQSGVKRKSGKNEWGVGEIPFQHEPWFRWGKNDWLNKALEYKKQGLKDGEIAEKMGLTSSEYKTRYKNAINEERIYQISANQALIEAGYINRSERARILGVRESTIRGWEDSESRERTERARATAEILKRQIDEKGPIDISSGAELRLGVSKDKMKQAVKILEDQGYEKYAGKQEQVTNEGKFTTMTFLCPPGTGHLNKEGKLVTTLLYDHPEQIHLIDITGSQIDMTSDDNGLTFRKAFQYPASMDSKRIFIRYGEEGAMNDGTIEIRPGVPDLNLGDSHYAQVRILVDNDKYMKGMAFYSNDIPEGYDCVYNSRKPTNDPNEVFKKIGKDPDNPFGSLIKEHGGQSTYIDPKTGEKKLSLINKRSDEGDWNEWSDKLASQFLSKQRMELVNQQLNLSIAEKRDELDTIMKLDNPTLKKHFLIDFAQAADKAAVELKAAALPGQKYKVILPVNSLSENECYCPEYDNGTVLALIRYPHGGTFEIPIVKVNNRNPEGKSKLGTSPLDAIGINYKVAQRLSGADFDGDTVLIIPNADKQHVLSTNPLPGLKGFDPEEKYGYVNKYGNIDFDNEKLTSKLGIKIMKEKHKQIQMGIVSNLITDMTIKGAPAEELAAAVRHSMVVIDAPKHKLDYTRSAKENGIQKLIKRYQGHYDLDGNWKESGASTIISRAANEQDVPKTQGDPHINEKTGELEWKPKSKWVIDNQTGKKVEVPDPYYINKKGQMVYYKQKSPQMMAVKDAFKLVSETQYPVEIAYAQFANSLKSMANEARKASLDSSLKLVYKPEVAKENREIIDNLKNKILRAESNAPLERAAQREATYVSNQKFKIDESLTEKEKGKIRQQAIVQARLKYGAERYPVSITDEEWDVIQKGGISNHMLEQIIQYADSDKLKARAMPRSIDIPSETKQARIRSMETAGYTIAEIAQRLDLSPTTVKKYLKVSLTRED